MKLSDIDWLEITDCDGDKVRVTLGRSIDGREVVTDGTNILEFVDNLATMSFHERSYPHRCKSNWPWIVEQLIAEGTLK